MSVSWTHKHPLMTGILASLVATISWSSSSSFLGVSIRGASVPLWLLAMSLVILLGLAVSLTLLLGANPRRIFLAVSAFQEKQFFSDVLQHVLLESAVQGFDTIVKAPKRDYSATNQDCHLRELLLRRRSYVGGILVPIEPHNRAAAMRDFIATFRKPVVFLDVPPFDKPDDYPQNTCFVGFDSLLGGKLAAKAMVKELREREVRNPQLLILGSNIQRGRQSGFEEHIREVFDGNATFEVNEDGRFVRDEAERLAKLYLRSARNGRAFDGIFCTNDEMALGVLNAMSMRPTKERARTIVIGFDGIREAVLRIERGDSPLVNTVVQDTRALAEVAMNSLAQLMRGESVNRVNLLPPTLYKNA